MSLRDLRVPVRTQDTVRVSSDPVSMRRISHVQNATTPFIVCPQGKIWDIRMISIRMGTDATAVNRQIVMRLDVPGLINPIYSEPFFDATMFQGPSKVCYYSWGKGIDHSVRSGTLYDGETHSLPDVLLYGLHSIQFGIENGQAGDSFILCYAGYEVDY